MGLVTAFRALASGASGLLPVTWAWWRRFARWHRAWPAQPRRQAAGPAWDR